MKVGKFTLRVDVKIVQGVVDQTLGSEDRFSHLSRALAARKLGPYTEPLDAAVEHEVWVAYAPLI